MQWYCPAKDDEGSALPGEDWDECPLLKNVSGSSFRSVKWIP